MQDRVGGGALFDVRTVAGEAELDPWRRAEAGRAAALQRGQPGQGPDESGAGASGQAGSPPPSPCGIGGCARRFASSGQLNRHRMSHHEEVLGRRERSPRARAATPSPPPTPPPARPSGKCTPRPHTPRATAVTLERALLPKELRQAAMKIVLLGTVRRREEKERMNYFQGLTARGIKPIKCPVARETLSAGCPLLEQALERDETEAKQLLEAELEALWREGNAHATPRQPPKFRIVLTRASPAAGAGAGERRNNKQ